MSSQQAVGGHCHACYTIGIDILYYGSMAEMKADMEACEQVRDRVAAIRKRQSEPETAPPIQDPESVNVVHGTRAKIIQGGQGLTYSEVKARVDAQRLSKEVLKNIPVISCRDPTVTQVDDIPEKERLYLFRNEDSKIDVQFETFVELGRGSSKLSSDQNLFSKQGEYVYDHCSKQFFKGDGLSGWESFHDFSSPPKSLTEFLGDYKEWHSKQVEKRKLRDAGSSSKSGGLRVEGRAAADFVLDTNDGDDEIDVDESGLHVDLAMHIASDSVADVDVDISGNLEEDMEDGGTQVQNDEDDDDFNEEQHEGHVIRSPIFRCHTSICLCLFAFLAFYDIVYVMFGLFGLLPNLDLHFLVCETIEVTGSATTSAYAQLEASITARARAGHFER